MACGTDNFPSKRHNKNEIKNAIERLKKIHLGALLTVKDLEAVYNLAEYDSNLEVDDDSDRVQWRMDKDDEVKSIALTALEKVKK